MEDGMIDTVLYIAAYGKRSHRRTRFRDDF